MLPISSHVFSPVSEQPDEMRSHHQSPQKYSETGQGRTVENQPEGPGFGLAGLDHMGTYALQLWAHAIVMEVLYQAEVHLRAGGTSNTPKLKL